MRSYASKPSSDAACSLTVSERSRMGWSITQRPSHAKQMQHSRASTPPGGHGRGQAADHPLGVQTPRGMGLAATPPAFGLVLALRARYLPNLFVRRIEHWGGRCATAHVSKEGLFFGLKPWELAVIWPGVQP